MLCCFLLVLLFINFVGLMREGWSLTLTLWGNRHPGFVMYFFHSICSFSCFFFLKARGAVVTILMLFEISLNLEGYELKPSLLN